MKKESFRLKACTRRIASFLQKKYYPGAVVFKNVSLIISAPGVEIFFVKPGGLELAIRQGQRLNFAAVFLFSEIDADYQIIIGFLKYG